jgi:hypothetical protein
MHNLGSERGRTLSGLGDDQSRPIGCPAFHRITAQLDSAARPHTTSPFFEAKLGLLC